MTAMWKGVWAAAAICAATAVVDATQQSGAMTRREPQFENGEVKVWKSIIFPNQPLSLHRHEHGRTIVALKGGTLDVVDPSGKTKEQMTWETGKAYWLDADAPNTQHGDQNKGKEPIEVIVVELKNDQKK